MGIGGDYELPVSTLTASDFPTNHADGIEASLFNDCQLGNLPSISKQLLMKAERKAGALPMALRAALENAKAGIAAHEGGSPAAAAEALERVGEEEVDHISLWNTVATMYLECEVADPKFGTAARLRASLRAPSAEPDNPVANFNVGDHPLRRKAIYGRLPLSERRHRAILRAARSVSDPLLPRCL